MGIFKSIGGSISKAAGTALNQTVRGVANQAIGNVVSRMPPVVGAAVGGLLSGQSLGQVVKGIAGGLINNALNQIPGGIGDFFRQAIGGGLAQSGFSFAGLPASRTQLLPADTVIKDVTDEEVEITIDTYLQGVQGSLSSTGSGLSPNIFGSSIGNMLAGSAISGALGAVTSSLSPGLGNAMNNFAGSLGNAVGKLTGDIGEGLTKIPGVGPVLGQVNKDLDSFSKNIGFSIGGVPVSGQQILGGVVLGVGANIIGKKLRKPKVSNQNQNTIRRNMEFRDNPAAQLENISNSCKRLGNKTKELNDPAFRALSQSAKRASKEMRKCLVKKNNGRWGFKNTLSNEVDGNVTKCVNGQIVELQLADLPSKTNDYTVNTLLNQSNEFLQLVEATGKNPTFLQSQILASGLGVSEYARRVYNGEIIIG